MAKRRGTHERDVSVNDQKEEEVWPLPLEGTKVKVGTRDVLEFAAKSRYDTRERNSELALPDVLPGTEVL